MLFFSKFDLHYLLRFNLFMFYIYFVTKHDLVIDFAKVRVFKMQNRQHILLIKVSPHKLFSHTALFTFSGKMFVNCLYCKKKTLNWTIHVYTIVSKLLSSNKIKVEYI